MSRALGSKLPMTSCETQICASVKSRSLWDFSRSRSSIAFSKNCQENLRVPIARFIQSGQNAANSEIGQKNAHGAIMRAQLRQLAKAAGAPVCGNARQRKLLGKPTAASM